MKGVRFVERRRKASDWSRGNCASTNQKHYSELGSDASSYGIAALVSQTSFRWETSGNVAKCRLFYLDQLQFNLMKLHSQSI